MIKEEVHNILLKEGLVQEEDARLTVNKQLEDEILESIFKMVKDLDLAGVRRIASYSKSLMLSEEAEGIIHDIVNAIDSGNIKVANQLANHSRT